jgi:hypothetical protein
MQQHIRPQAVFHTSKAFARFLEPLDTILPRVTPLTSRGNHPLSMGFEHQLKSLVYYHLKQFDSGRHLLQDISENPLARQLVAPPEGIAKSSFFEAINSRGREQFMEVFTLLSAHASAFLPKAHPELGDLVAVDGSLIDCTLTMEWANYQKGFQKAKAHIGFDPGRSIPKGFVLTNGNGNEKDQVETLVPPHHTGIMDRGYQCHADLDRWHSQGRFYVCRIRESTAKRVIRKLTESPQGNILSDEQVVLGSIDKTFTTTPVRLVTFRAGRKVYCIATNRFDLTAQQIADIYLLRWSVEIFFGWWKRHLLVYHLIARSQYGLSVQLLAGLITYLLLAIFCHEQFGERVSIKRVRQLQIQIQNQSFFFIFFPFFLLPFFRLRYAIS